MHCCESGSHEPKQNNNAPSAKKFENSKIIIAVFVIAIILGGFLLLREPQSEVSPKISSSAARTSEQEPASFIAISSAELAAMLPRKDFFFINVHTPYEGEIKNTDVFIPYDRIADNLDKLPNDKNAKITLYCRSGRMSEIAAQELTRLGYTRVSHLSGGMNDWGKNGYEIIYK